MFLAQEAHYLQAVLFHVQDLLMGGNGVYAAGLVIRMQVINAGNEDILRLLIAG